LRRPALLALESPVRYSQSKISRRYNATAASPASPDGPLKGIRILDFGRILAGPFCTQILADYGADVIKIEQPGLGDETRSWKGKEEATAWKPDVGPMSFYFASVNRNKRSVTLDLKKPEALKIVHKLVKESDVVIENFVPGGADRLGIGYAALSKINPRLIYASVSGYGSGGPYANRAGYDAIAAAEGGLMHITGAADGGPVRPGLGMTDMSTGLYTHGAIMAALLHRAKTGKGQYISASLFETQLSLLINVGANWLNMGIDGKRWGAAHPSIVPYNTWKCKDDVWLTVAANNDKQYQKFCRIIDRNDLAEDTRYATNTQRIERRSEMEEIFEAVFAAKTSQEWLKLLDGTGLAHGQVNTVQKAFEHPQAIARDMVQNLNWDAVQSGEWKGIGPAVKFSESKASIRSRPPVLGEHTDDVLAEAGYDSEEIQRLREQGAI
ncbi:formyl-coenzyme A transferase, partial [Aureobasidium melanogenum]